ncbi:glycosyltransferase family 4 protein [Winogradskyella sp. A3E31]|uniref:glycosyltransferase family 4 protein n=1 Tax=Winogradskyella sp. A3E31 TaxID=3349637 RepID=UPI00398B2985
MSHSNLLIIGFVWPEPRSSAAGSRLLQIIEQFQNQGFDIVFATAAKHSDNAFDLDSISVKAESIKLNDSSFDDFVKNLNPDVVVFDRFMVEEQFGWRVTEQCPNAIRILDTEDFHGLRKAREEVVKKNKTLTVEDLYNDTTKREIASIYRCDLSLIISEFEMNLLQEDFNIDQKLLHYLPFLMDSVSETSILSLPTFEERHHFMTIGNFLHPPNCDAVLYLKNNIWPLIRKQLPNAELHIYGAYESQKVNQLNDEKTGFLIKGFAEDVNTVMQNAKVCLAPLRFGAGLKGKLIDAMQNGTPCIMSSIAAEGMFGDINPCGFIEDSPETFAQKAIQLYNQPDVWKEMQQNGFETISKRFDKKKFETEFSKTMEYLQINLKNQRLNNFMGQVLMHHTLQSIKYMSKWIEEKNR